MLSMLPLGVIEVPDCVQPYNLAPVFASTLVVLVLIGVVAGLVYKWMDLKK